MKTKGKATGNQKSLALMLALLIFFQSTGQGLMYFISESETGFKEIKYVPVKSTFKKPNDSTKVETEMVEEKSKTVLPETPSEGGPDQPEVQSFTPIGTSDMVDPFTGDFSYNIPLLDVDGYPINLAYTAGVTMDQEASWVGLGWNVNPGVLNRALRGLPDDFNGTDIIEKEMSQKPNVTTSVNYGFETEVFGIPIIEGLNANFGMSLNNYTGVSASYGFGFNFKFPVGKNSALVAGLGFNGDSQSGANLDPNLSFQSEKSKDNPLETVTKKLTIGSPFNSRGGLQSISMSYSRTLEKYKFIATNHIPLFFKESSTGGLPMSSSFNLGNTTFSPRISMPMNTTGFTFSVKLGIDASGIDPTFPLKGTISSTYLYDKNLESRAYGYNNLRLAISDEKAVIDFSRENDGAITKNTPALSNTALTYDIFSPSGHGVSGSYRAVRDDIGYVFDPKMSTYAENGSLGLEASIGAGFKNGFDIGLTFSDSQSSVWDEQGNKAIQDVKFTNDRITYREANELSVDPNYNDFLQFGGEKAVRFDLQSTNALKPSLVDNSNNSFTVPNTTDNSKRIRNQVLNALTIQEQIKELGVNTLPINSYAFTHPEVHDHNGQYTVLNVEGSRYVYGIPAFSHFQKSVSFSVEFNTINHTKGTVDFTYDLDNTTANNKGTDHYFSSEKTPPFAHSYLLTSVLNSDYIDSDNIKGPSKNDLGGYVTFEYKQIDLFKWRIPYGLHKASYDEGLNTDSGDDKGHYTYGEKELWYLERLKSKNHIAVFYTSPRKDGNQMDESGLLDFASPKMQRLDSIALFTVPDYEKNGINATPIKVVHFEYEYTLCKSYPLNSNTTGETGKLTLIKVYFTYQRSNKGRFSAYEFDYSTFNPDYNAKSSDKWGGYKKQPDNLNGQIEQDPLRPSDFPYVDFDQVTQDKYASAWNLKKIHLPSGGAIEVDYESDDYAYVQNKRAAQMFKIVGVEFNNGGVVGPQFGNQTINLSNPDIKNAKVYFELMPKHGGGFYTDIKEYIPEYQPIYFRALMKFKNGYDFVPGFAPAKEENITIEEIGGIPYGVIKFDGAQLMDNGNADYNPIAVAGIQFGRLHLNKFIPPSNSTDFGNAGDPGMVDAIVGIFGAYKELLTGPNFTLWDKKVGTDLVLNHSWLRLQNPNKKRLGGGHRVKEIRIYDAWDELTNNQMEGFSYGQSYSYADKDGNSSGVASYEPMLGGDENIFRKPVSFDNNLILAPDENNYQIEPYGEQFFPTASVGYESVTISNLKRTNVTRTATGKVVHEFYTAKDFPTIVDRTEMDYKRFKMPSVNFFYGYMNEAMSASQGFVVQTNDMHGKPKSQAVYAEGKIDALSTVSYLYKSSTISYNGKMINKLENKVSTIKNNGTVSTNQLGICYDAVADFRKSTSTTISGSIDNNANTIIFIPVITIPAFVPSGSIERTAYRGATFTKVIERFGIQETTIATDLGSVVKTSNLAYDAATGVTLLTKTQTDFNDAVYNLTFPAHWYYNNMGQAYSNIDFTQSDVDFVNGSTSEITSLNAVPGDEIYLIDNTDQYILAWVLEATSGGIKLVDKEGVPIEGHYKSYKVIRSGRKNVQTTPIGTITLRENPLNTIKSNIYEDVLQASVTEFSDDWRTFCDCFLKEDENGNPLHNPYVVGVKGNWRPSTSYVHLSGRNQHYTHKNTDIRNDGFMTSFSPFYQLENGKWKIKKDNWTYTSSVTEFSPFGQALETKDALNRFTSSQFGYNQTFAIAVAANTRYKQLGYDGFEDYDFDNCSDNHFRFANDNSQLTSKDSHTGNYGIAVNHNSSVTLTKPLNNGCDLKPCDIKITPQVNNKTIECTISGGNLPYSIDPAIINGSPISTINETGNIIHFSSNSRYEINLKVTDSKGCTQTINLKTSEQ
jgi:hypothetical protein